MKIYRSILEIVGNTPIVSLNKVTNGCSADIYAKLEMFNPSGSAKARAALGMIEDAEQKGIIRPGETTIIEPTSGNQGIGLAMVGAVKGYRVIVVMPDTMSKERQDLVKAYGAEVVLSKGEEDIQGAVNLANELLRQYANSWMPNQFGNPANPDFHAQTTAQEILGQMDEVDAYIAGVGTGGTLTGVARVLKKKFPAIQVFAVEPKQSAVISGNPPGSHRIQGIGDGFIPENLDMSVVDGALAVDENEAIDMTRRLAMEEGILAGISSGAAVVAAIKVGQILGQGKKVLTLLPDTGERYLSTRIFER
ncbi:MAG: cysteine synthase A [Bacillota bacterium]|jgi:cysteine synthase A